MLKNKRVVVTGANGALGRAVVDAAAEACAEIVGIDLEFETPRDGVHCITADLTDTAAARAALSEAGAIDALLNIAGGFTMGPAVHETGDDDWDRMFGLNVTTLRNTVAATVPGMLERGRGSIVNVGALGAREGQAAMGAYCAAKSAVMRLTESLSAELRAEGINVNAVLPSIIDTPANRADMPDADFGKWVAPADLANVICFLASDAARAVHGALVPVRGLS